MNNDFKKSSYVLTIIFFFIGIAALVGVSAGKYFQFDEIVVTVSQIVSLLAFFIIFINCIYAKSRYNNACVRFAEYIINNRRKESERKFAEAERMQEVENTVRAEAQRDREKAVTAALQQGRSEGAMGARQSVSAQQGFPVPKPTPVQFQQPTPVQFQQPTPSSFSSQRLSSFSSQRLSSFSSQRLSSFSSQRLSSFSSRRRFHRPLRYSHSGRLNSSRQRPCRIPFPFLYRVPRLRSRDCLRESPHRSVSRQRLQTKRFFIMNTESRS